MEHLNNIWKYLQQELTDPEREVFEAWLNASKENRMAFNAVKSIWDESDEAQKIIPDDADAAWESFQQNVIGKNPASTRWIRIAGIAASFLLIASVLLWLSLPRNNTALYHEFYTQNESAELSLPDSSKITLAPRSYIRYFTRLDENSASRTVYIKGKGYFDIQQDSARPFIVEIAPAGVEVLGTSFIIDQKDSTEIEVKNITGLIRFFELANEDNDVLINPGETFSYDSTGFKDITVREKNTPEEPGEDLTIDAILNYLFLRFDGRFNTGPYGHFDSRAVIRIDLDQSLASIIQELDEKTTMVYRKTCPDCYEIRSIYVDE